jgi:hypothetical protein
VRLLVDRFVCAPIWLMADTSSYTRFNVRSLQRIATFLQQGELRETGR